MAHQRKLIRAAVESALKAANTVAGQRVFRNRSRQIFPTEIPCVLLYTKNEPADISAESPREYERKLNLVLELVCQATKEEILDDALDDFCEQIETAMFVDETFGGVCTDTVLSDTEVEILSEGEKPIGAAKLTFQMPYFQQLPGDPKSPLDDFKKAQVTIDPQPNDAVTHAKAVDTINVPII